MANTSSPTPGDWRHDPVYHRHPEEQDDLGRLASVFPTLRVDLVVAVYDDFGGSFWRTWTQLGQIEDHAFLNAIFIWGWEDAGKDWDQLFLVYKGYLAIRILSSPMA